MVVTRFPPSPTGDLHVGSARTALYSWLYAKKHKGEFVLRIEDTDLERSTPEAVQVILDAMAWLKLDWTQGPFYQTKRFDRYKEVIASLLDSGKAYKCYCSKERLQILRDTQTENKEKPRYDLQCLKHPKTEAEAKGLPYVIRFNNPKDGAVIIDDQVKGVVEIQNTELDDLIIARQDGVPTYNLCVVVDDMDMGITHVIRGDDHLSNTPRQINILKALGAPIPVYAHIPMILGSDGKRLSKRHGAVSVLNYKEEGYLPEALLNYLVRLGWSHQDQEIFSTEEMIEFFDIKDINRAPSAFNYEKLQWLNQHYMKTMPTRYVADCLIPHIESANYQVPSFEVLEKIILLQRERAKTLVEMVQKSAYFLQADIVLDADAAAKHLTNEILEPLKAFAKGLEALTSWTEANIHAVIEQVCEQFSIKLGKIAQPIRVAVTGNTVSPSIAPTIEIIGQKETLNRLAKAIQFVQ